MSVVHTRQCMFCHDPLPVRRDVPENLAFMEHLTCEPSCREEFRVWRQNMQVDFLGD